MKLLETIRNWFRAVAGNRHEHRASEEETSATPTKKSEKRPEERKISQPKR